MTPAEGNQEDDSSWSYPCIHTHMWWSVSEVKASSVVSSPHGQAHVDSQTAPSRGGHTATLPFRPTTLSYTTTWHKASCQAPPWHRPHVNRQQHTLNNYYPSYTTTKQLWRRHSTTTPTHLPLPLTSSFLSPFAIARYHTLTHKASAQPHVQMHYLLTTPQVVPPHTGGACKLPSVMDQRGGEMEQVKAKDRLHGNTGGCWM